MSLLLDTNVVSELRKGARTDVHVRAWFAEVDDGEIYLSVLVIGELRRGIERIRRRDAAKARALERWLTRVTRQHTDRILPVDRRVAEQWGRFSSVRSASPLDTKLDRDIAEALGAAHEHGVIHRDLNARYACRSKGLRQATPVHTTSRTLRVTKVMSWT